VTDNIHDRVRKDHHSEIAEDYVEAIGQQISEQGSCRAVDLVNKFSVTHATVNNTLARLERDGLVKTEPYRPVELTDRGRRMAKAARKRHEIVERFLCRIGVSPDTAAIDSEGIEHHVSPETLAAMENVLRNGLADMTD
jgi:DtxR family transcriptional regulator, manganese transport regulator